MTTRLGATGPYAMTATHQGPFKLFGPTNSTRTAALTVASGMAPTTTLPATSIAGSGAASGDKYATFPGPTNQVQVGFFGSGSGASWNQWQAIGVKELLPESGSGSQFIRRPLVKVTTQMGAMVGVSGMSVPAGCTYCDKIIIEADSTPGSGARVAGNDNGGIATLTFDAMGNEIIEWEPINSTPSGGNPTASMNGFYAGL
jgi:hypothetical protein